MNHFFVSFVKIFVKEIFEINKKKIFLKGEKHLSRTEAFFHVGPRRVDVSESIEKNILSRETSHILLSWRRLKRESAICSDEDTIVCLSVYARMMQWMATRLCIYICITKCTSCGYERTRNNLLLASSR